MTCRNILVLPITESSTVVCNALKSDNYHYGYHYWRIPFIISRRTHVSDICGFNTVTEECETHEALVHALEMTDGQPDIEIISAIIRCSVQRGIDKTVVTNGTMVTTITRELHGISHDAFKITRLHNGEPLTITKYAASIVFKAPEFLLKNIWYQTILTKNVFSSDYAMDIKITD